MIVSRTPYRISFFGGGTDYPAWYRRHGGLVLATTIDRYCYISCRYLPPFFEHRHRVVWSKIENVASISQIEHPAVRAVLEWDRLDEGVEIHHNGDLPARSGIGSSSSFTVGLIKALHALRGTDVGKAELAQAAIHIERDILNENVGAKDQISAAFGGLNRIELSPDGLFRLAPVALPPERLQQLQMSLMLFFTGISRNASEIAGSKIANIEKREHELSRTQEMVDQSIGILQDPAIPIEEFGRLLDTNWRLKRKLSEKVSTPLIDRIYQQALRAKESEARARSPR